jgi:fatty-acyl-CoA synthase
MTERVRDVIITGGENVYPAEVEQALLTHRDVMEVAVVAGSDPKWGEVPVAFVVPGESRDVDLASLTAWLEGSLARFKHPRAVVVVDELPRNAMGKVLKHELRERLGHPTTVATATSV